LKSTRVEKDVREPKFEIIASVRGRLSGRDEREKIMKRVNGDEMIRRRRPERMRDESGLEERSDAFERLNGHVKIHERKERRSL
jgi:hypothetical protein